MRITAMISHVLICFSAVQYMIFRIFICAIVFDHEGRNKEFIVELYRLNRLSFCQRFKLKNSIVMTQSQFNNPVGGNQITVFHVLSSNWSLLCMKIQNSSINRSYWLNFRSQVMTNHRHFTKCCIATSSEWNLTHILR